MTWILRKKTVDLENLNVTHKVDTVTIVIIYMKKLLDSDWLRAVQKKCNTSAKSVIPVQIRH